MMTSCALRSFLWVLCILSIVRHVNGHGILEFPCQRGALNPKGAFTDICDDSSAPDDFLKHFPAGDKTAAPGSARRSQIATGGKWTSFEPLKKDFVWRAGVCGDLKSGSQDHMKGGKFYHGGKVVAEYNQGAVIDITVKLIAHHNGFMEFHLCDVAKCGGEISEECFKDGHCYQLKRAPNSECDSGNDMDCGPIDRTYPGRWYLPCPQVPYNQNIEHRYGGKKMQYVLPSGVSCEHCVLQWYWAGGNDCNSPGIREYFDGPDAPNWGDCKGQAGARGGFSRVQRDCGPNLFPEEYLQCADIGIKSSGNSPDVSVPESSSAPVEAAPETATTPTEVTPITTPAVEQAPSVSPMIAEIATPTPMTEGVSMQGATMESQEKSMTTSPGSFTGIAVIGDDQVIVENVSDNQEIDVSGYERVALEAMKGENNGPVDFYIDGQKVWTDYGAPFFLYGNRGRSPTYAQSPPLNQEFSIEAMASDGSIKVRMTLMK